MLVCAIFMAFILLSIDEVRSGVTNDFIINLFCLLLEVFLNHTSCSYAQIITNRSFDVADNFYNTPWYTFPCDQQKMIVMTIHRAQKPFHLLGYKLFTCNIATFLTVWCFKCEITKPIVFDQLRTNEIWYLFFRWFELHSRIFFFSGKSKRIEMKFNHFTNNSRRMEWRISTIFVLNFLPLKHFGTWCETNYTCYMNTWTLLKESSFY